MKVIIWQFGSVGTFFATRVTKKNFGEMYDSILVGDLSKEMWPELEKQIGELQRKHHSVSGNGVKINNVTYA